MCDCKTVGCVPDEDFGWSDCRFMQLARRHGDAVQREIDFYREADQSERLKRLETFKSGVGSITIFEIEPMKTATELRGE